MDLNDEEVQRRFAKLQTLLNEFSDCDVEVSITAGRGRVCWSRLADASPQNASAATRADSAFRFLALPRELQDQIVKSLARKDLIAMSSTCRGLRANLEPAVFSSFRVHAENRKVFCERLSGLYRNDQRLIRFIRSLSIHVPGPFLFGGPNRPLETTVDYLITDLKVLQRFLCDSKSGLEYLELEHEGIWLSPFQSRGVFGSPVFALTQLHTLRLGIIDGDANDHNIAKALKASPNLHSLQIYRSHIPDHQPFLEVPANLHLTSFFMGHASSTHEYSDVLNVLNSFPRLQNLALLGNFSFDPPQFGELGHFHRAFDAIKEKGKHLRRLSLPIGDDTDDDMEPMDEPWYYWVREFLSALPMLNLVQFPCYDDGGTVFAAKRTNGAVLKLDDLSDDESDGVGLEIEELDAADAFKTWPCGLRGLTADLDRPHSQGPAQ